MGESEENKGCVLRISNNPRWKPLAVVVATLQCLTVLLSNALGLFLDPSGPQADSSGGRVFVWKC